MSRFILNYFGIYYENYFATSHFKWEERFFLNVILAK